MQNVNLVIDHDINLYSQYTEEAKKENIVFL